MARRSTTKSSDGGEPGDQQKAPATFRLPREHLRERVANGRHAYPWYERIRDEDRGRLQVQDTRPVQDQPERIVPLDAVEQVVTEDEREPDRQDHGHWQEHDQPEEDHRAAQCPDHDERGDLVVEVELVGQAAEERDLEQDEQQSARDQEARELILGAREARERPAPVPVNRKNVGAQMCVIQRVKKSATEVVAMLVGFAPKVPKKSRVWSSAMMIMTMPRSTSIDSTRWSHRCR